MTRNTHRKLAAILAADVVGYGRLMGDDETATLDSLTANREELIGPKITEHEGRVVKLMGDGLLAEFPSAVEAVQCAIEIQHAMGERNADVPEDRRIAFRIGINIGDIIVEGDDIYGDGVNIAARLEALAAPGGVVISRNIYSQVKGKLDLGLTRLGKQTLKNISEPVAVYAVTIDSKAHASTPPVAAGDSRKHRLWTAAAFAAVTLRAIFSARWVPWSSLLEQLSIARTEAPTAEKPSVAVLPFGNLGGDDTTRRIANGLTKDIITDLARFPEFNVIARNSTEIYADRPVDARDVGEALGVNYVLEGSIQKEEEQFRITAQLIDAASGNHLWAERWDRPVADVFAVQTEIAEYVANQMGGGAGLIQQTERTAARRKRPEDLTAYELYLLGAEKLDLVTREDIEEAIRLLNQAVELDPGLARAWVELYHAHSLSSSFGAESDSAMEAAMEAAERAVMLDPSDAEAHAVLGSALAVRGEFARAKAAFDTALRLAPNAFKILAYYASYSGTWGDPEGGAEMAERAILLNPNYPMWASGLFAWAFFVVGRYEDTLRMLDRQTPDNYTKWRWAARGGALASLGRSREAEVAVRLALERYPDLTIEGIIDDPSLSDGERQRFIETMRLAGFPSCVSPEERAQLSEPARLPECEVPSSTQD